MIYYEEVYELPVFDLKTEFENLNLDWLKSADPFGGDQICVNAPQGYTDDYHFGSGNFKKADVPGGYVFVRGQEEIELSTKTIPDWLLCDVFKDTVIEEVYNVLHSFIKPGRIRFIKTKPKTCMTLHTDPIPRLHYPIKTQEGCWMIIGEELFHLPENKWYKTYVNKAPHTIVNASKEDRIHLVVDILP